MCVCGETPSFFVEEYPVARKEHKCCECFSTIAKGEKYQVAKGVWDGEFGSYKTCEICYKVRDEAIHKGRDLGECLAFGYLWETVGIEFECVI